MTFLSNLNKYRSLGKFDINQTSFKNIGEILTLILDEINKEKDFESASNVIILSQTFHYLTKNKKKRSLQKTIENHPLFKSIEFWENFISCKFLIE